MIHVIATIEVAPEHRDAFLEEFRRIVPLVRAEAGCIQYVPAIDTDSQIPVQAPLRPDVVTVIEAWENEDTLRDHLTAPHMMDYRQKVKDWVQATTLRILQPMA